MKIIKVICSYISLIFLITNCGENKDKDKEIRTIIYDVIEVAIPGNDSQDVEKLEKDLVHDFAFVESEKSKPK